MTASRPTTAPGRACAVVHGTHPLRGYAVTWRLTPLPPGRDGHASFLVEQADGHLTDDEAWRLAVKDTAVLPAHEARALVARVRGAAYA